jgi:hypothetical protein
LVGGVKSTRKKAITHMMEIAGHVPAVKSLVKVKFISQPLFETGLLKNEHSPVHPFSCKTAPNWPLDSKHFISGMCIE